jgi:hypothetical protein
MTERGHNPEVGIFRPKNGFGLVVSIFLEDLIDII